MPYSIQPLISLKNIYKTFMSGKTELPILKAVNADIAPGSFTVIYGASGSGKSTLLNTLVGLDAPTKGSVMYGNKDVYGLSKDELANFRAHTIGIVQQSNTWVKSLNVLENIAMPLYFQGVKKEAAINQAREALKRVNMESYALLRPSYLSGGEQQRVAMARAIVNNPSYIVADEPTGSLDTENGDRIIQLLRYFNKELERTVVLVTHNLEYLPLATQLLFIKDGVVTNVDTDIKATTHKLIEDMEARINHLAEDYVKQDI
jgi:ABC-type lipoprotein export system ATPase subunit